MLEALVGQVLPAPAVVDWLVLVEVANQNPLQPAEGQLGQLRPTGEINHRTFVDDYPAGGVFAPADGLVGEVVDGEPAHVVGRQVRLGEESHALALVLSQELDKLSGEMALSCPRRPGDEHALSSFHCLLCIYVPPCAETHTGRSASVIGSFRLQCRRSLSSEVGKHL